MVNANIEMKEWKKQYLGLFQEVKRRMRVGKERDEEQR